MTQSKHYSTNKYLSSSDVVKATSEAKRLEFKSQFNVHLPSFWCELIKDIVALANSGGGTLAIGLNNDGSVSGSDLTDCFNLDVADIVNQLAKYTGREFDQFTTEKAEKDNKQIFIFHVNGIYPPMVFIKHGNYLDESTNTQKTAFSKGTVYFRHGPKSEPGNNEDLHQSLEREISRQKKSWLSNIKKIMYSSSSPEIKLHSSKVNNTDTPVPIPAKIIATDDTNIPIYRWDDTAYQTPDEILTGVLKSWKHDKTSYASHSDIMTIYTNRKSLKLDEEKSECLLDCSINRFAPFFYFASFLSIERLKSFIKNTCVSGKHPSPPVVVQLSHAIGGHLGDELLDYIIEHCEYLGTKNAANNRKDTVHNPNRLRIVYSIGFIKFSQKTYNTENLTPSFLESLLKLAIENNDHASIKKIDCILYAPLIDHCDQKIVLPPHLL